MKYKVVSASNTYPASVKVGTGKPVKESFRGLSNEALSKKLQDLVKRGAHFYLTGSCLCYREVDKNVHLVVLNTPADFNKFALACGGSFTLTKDNTIFIP